MNSSTFFNTETLPAYKAFLFPGSKTTREVENNSLNIPGAALKILQHHSVQFTAALAHEVRNPLANINLSVKMLESAIKDNDLKMYLDIIMRSSIRIDNLVKELLKCGHTDEVRIEKYSLHQLLDEVLEMAGDRIALKKIAVRKVYTTKDYKMVLNRPEMKIALTNIIINAIDAMTSGKGQLTLITTFNNGRYRIQIEDNGQGISKEDLKYIFKPYFTNKPDGLGLGLTKTYDILRANDIRVAVESKVGKGTRFTLLFEQRAYKQHAQDI